MKSFIDLLEDELSRSKTIGNMSIETLITALILGLIAGLIIYMVYRFSHSGVMFINQFGITLVGLTMVTTLIILTITSNLLLSLGMVGALSIVRFRTAIKEPIDMVYMFWSIATGVAVGAGFFMLAGIALVIIGLVLYFLSKYSQSSDLFILVLRSDTLIRDDLESILSKECKSFKFRAESSIENHLEFTYELRMKETDVLMKLLQEHSKDFSLVGYHNNTLV